MDGVGTIVKETRQQELSAEQIPLQQLLLH